MRRVTEPDGCQEGIGDKPDDAARRRAAVELIRRNDRQLRWTARRYSICAEDAEDAYQRGIEILLLKAPTTDHGQLLPWTRTVVKHEALAIRKTRERTMGRPGPPPDHDHADDDWVQLIPAEGDGPDELAVRRERVARSKEALALLKPAELKALTQLAEGFSYSEIGEMNHWTRTKVNRCLAEGRARFRSAFRESEEGERCEGFEPLLSACCDGELNREQMKELENHLGACGHCRATLRAYRAAPRAAAALIPVLPFGHGLWNRIQELVVGVHLRLQGIGRGSDSGVQGVVASGGSGGVAATVKLAALCAGTAGTAAVCAATGVVPVAGLAARDDEKPRIEKVARKQATAPAVEQVGQSNPPSHETADEDPVEAVPVAEPESKHSTSTEAPPVATSESTPAPTPTQAEFTPEVAGTPVQTDTSPPAASQSSSTTTQAGSSQVPLGNGGGEFTP